jgi:hypothetical protein
MSIRYTNTNASQLISAGPRDVYRIVVQRRTIDAPDYWTGLRTMRKEVQRVIDHSAGPAGFPLGNNMANVFDQDTVATLDYRAATNPGIATVGDLVRQVNDAGRLDVSSIERRPPVPASSDGGAAALDAERDRTQAAERDSAADRSFASQIGAAVKGIGRTAVWLGIAGLAIAAVVFIPRGSR